MKSFSKPDLLINVISPAIAGALLYLLSPFLDLPSIIRSHASDACWAYALISAILIIWERHIHEGWVVTSFLFCIGFEILQGYHILAGTGDIKDVITYFLFFLVGLSLNKFFQLKFNKQVQHVNTR